MSRRLPFFIILFLFTVNLFFAPAVFGVDPDAITPTPNQIPPKVEGSINSSAENSPLDKALVEFCKKRSGNQMNLETWYSGKCADSDQTLIGEGVGFSDIIFLDLIERIWGPKKSSTSTLDSLKYINSTHNILQSDSSLTQEEKDLALNNLRLDFYKQQGGGLISDFGNFAATLIQTRPASTQAYLSYISENLHKNKLVPTALAAQTGAGFDTIKVFIPLWKASRNLAYTVMVMFFIVYGFMMMFRVNLGQKTVISIQLAIPKLIVTLLVITFSFAIVGLIFDLMWVFMYFIPYYLGNQGILFFNSDLSKGNPFIYGASGLSGLLFSFILNSLAAATASPVVITNLLIGGPTLFGLVLGVAGGAFPLTRPIALFLAIVIALAVLISFAKLTFKLLTAFLSVILSLITGPIVLLGNAFPGSNAIGTWTRGVVANVSVFPVTSIFLVFPYALMVQPLTNLCNGLPVAATGFSACEWFFGVKNLNPGGYIFNIPMITPIMGFAPDALLALMGIMLLLMSSKYVDMVRDALKVPPFKYGTAIEEALKQSWNTIGRVPSVSMNPIYQEASKLIGTGAKAKTPTPGAGGGTTTPPP